MLAGTRTRSGVLGMCFMLLALPGTSPAFSEERFSPAPGLAVLDASVTGVYLLGTVRFGATDADIVALVHGGQVLDVHSRHRGRWLAKRAGSAGGKGLAPPRFDQLASIAGGIDMDVRALPGPVQEKFAATAGVVILGLPSIGTPDRAGTPYNDTGSGRPGVASGQDCAPIDCQLLYQHPGRHGPRFKVSLDSAQGTWRFEGYGIVAVWSAPER
jgi:hypothetical protein